MAEKERTLKELMDALRTRGKEIGLTQEEIDGLLNLYEANKDMDPMQFAQLVQNTPVGKMMADNMQLARRLPLEQSRASGVLGAVADLVGLGMSIDQIATANRERDLLKEPGRPGMSSTDPGLMAAIRRAQLGATSPYQDPAVALAIKQNQDAYMTGLGQARTASGGQAGAYGALAQSLYGRRLMGNQQVGALAAQTSAQKEAQLGQLLQTKQRGDLYRDMNKADLYKTDVSKWLTESKAVGDLGAAGRLNTLTSLQNLGQNLSMPLAYNRAQNYVNRYNAAMVPNPGIPKTQPPAPPKPLQIGLNSPNYSPQKPNFGTVNMNLQYPGLNTFRTSIESRQGTGAGAGYYTPSYETLSKRYNGYNIMFGPEIAQYGLGLDMAQYNKLNQR